MEAYVLDWLNLLGRWAHFVVGIAWIGSSFYFIWLDNHLQAPAQAADSEKGVGGELWSVHGGGFYHAQKYRVAPPALPETLHWFKWEAYSTWLTGMFLLALIYWYGAEVYLIDPSVAELSPPVAVLSSIGIIAGSWLLYDLLCRSPLGRNDNAVALILLPAVTLLAWGLTQLYSGRGAYIHFGAALGTIMVANVFFVIIPGQRKMVVAAERGEAPDPEPGLRARQRSVHNTYFTLPVLFTMISNHYALAYNHAYNWLILVALSLAGALVRVYFVARHKGRASPLPIAAAAAILLAVAAAIAPRTQAGAPVASATGERTEQVTLDDVHPIIQARCTNCHSSNPTFAAFPAPPSGVLLDTPEQIRTEATRIHQQAVVLRAMPIGNLTRMTDEERQLIDAWYRGLQ
jgi:uncharacterized membrane protein